MLAVLTAINLLNYIDRYIFSALLPAIKADLKFTDTELGLLGSGFILAYLVVAPLFGYLGDRGKRSHIMAIGISLWSVATAFSGLARSFVSQMSTRIVVGLGESAYTVIAPSTLADHFPKVSRGKIFAIYSGAIPVGSALGYLLGGILEAHFGWRRAFFVVGIPGLVLGSILYFLPEAERGHAERAQADEGEALANGANGGVVAAVVNPYRDANAVVDQASTEFWTAVRRLAGNGGYMTTVLGYAAYTFVVGGMAFWMPSYIVRYFDVSLQKGNVIFGGVTVAGGFIGTLLGGWWGDRIERTKGNGYLKVCAYSMLFTVPMFFVVLGTSTFTMFAVALFFMEIGLFICTSPLDAAVLSYVRPEVRGQAMAWNVFLIHLLGDGISRVLIGHVSDGSGLKAAIGFCPWVLLLAGVLWFLGVIFYWQPLSWPRFALKLPMWQAHRGYCRTGAQENTLAAFRLAHANGAPMVELDTHLSKDGIAVVVHDLDLKRIAGLDLAVDSLTAVELNVRAQVPTLLSVLTDSNVPSRVNIEIKSPEFRDDRLERAVSDAVLKAGAQDRVIFSSFNPFSLRKMAKLLPNVPRALLVTEEKEPKNKLHLRKMWLASLARPHVVNLDQEMCSARRMNALNERGVPFAVWTVNNPERAKELWRAGAQSIITDENFAPIIGA
jgi:glycerophosphoryl diester phosphodiesterase/predicted MFS family arabinose efflux permease